MPAAIPDSLTELFDLAASTSQVCEEHFEVFL